MIVKTIAVISFLFIIYSLGIALFNLTQSKSTEHSTKIFKALVTRIALSLLLFMFVFISVISGWIKPDGIAASILLSNKHTAENQNSKP